jgi:hypothetical protein
MSHELGWNHKRKVQKNQEAEFQINQIMRGKNKKKNQQKGSKKIELRKMRTKFDIKIK